VVKNLATLAATTFSANDPDGHDRYFALAQRVSNSINQTSGTQQIESIQTQIAGANASAQAAGQRLTDKQPIYEGILDDIENASPEEVGTKLLALDTRLQASLQTTAMLSKLTLLNFLS